MDARTKAGQGRLESMQEFSEWMQRRGDQLMWADFFDQLTWLSFISPCLSSLV